MSHGQKNSSYSAAVESLNELSWFGARLGLETTLDLTNRLGNPHQGLRFIHVAGTNGKGSTCAILESVYRAAGLRVGLFTSPHLVSFRERIQVNRQLIPETDVVRLVEDLRSHLKMFTRENSPTFFEVVTVMALQYFAEQHCDLIIWETGLGGRLDATNIVAPIASVITNIQYDHQKWLGSSLSSIAAEKAGIIKPGVPVITGTDAPEALAVIQQTAAKQSAPLIIVENKLHDDRVNDLALLGEYQRRNADIALATIDAVQNVIPVSPENIRDGLARVQWPGRLQLVKLSDGRRILLDGAHNVAGAEALACALKMLFPAERPALILGILSDKDWSGMFHALASLAGRIILVPVQNERTTDPAELIATCQAFNSTAEVISRKSLSDALSEVASAPLIVIAGSLYLIGEAMELLELAPTATRDERRLNEWTGSNSKL